MEEGERIEEERLWLAMRRGPVIVNRVSDMRARDAQEVMFPFALPLSVSASLCRVKSDEIGQSLSYIDSFRLWKGRRIVCMKNQLGTLHC